MKTFIFALALCSVAPAIAATLDEQIAAANRQADSLRVVANQLGSQLVAARLDSLAQADSTLAANGVRVVGGADSLFVKIAIDQTSGLGRKLIRASLGPGVEVDRVVLKYELIAPDTLSLRRDRAEKALPVISAALRE